MAVFNKTYIDGNLTLQDTLNDKNEVILNSSYKISGDVQRGASGSYTLNQEGIQSGTKLLSNIQTELSNILGRYEKLNIGYWAETLKYDHNGAVGKNYFVMTHEIIKTTSKDANGNEVVTETTGDPNVSVYLIGDSIRIFGRLEYRDTANNKKEKDELINNFSNRTILRIRIKNPNNLIKCVHKAAGQTAGYGTASAIYAVNTPVGSRIAVKNLETKKYDVNTYRTAVDEPTTSTSQYQVNKKDVTGRMCAADDDLHSIWIDIKLSAVVDATSVLSFYITCPVELNETYFTG
mgnify:CR=1 FL=1